MKLLKLRKYKPKHVKNVPAKNKKGIIQTLAQFNSRRNGRFF